MQKLQNYNFKKITSLHQIMRAPVKSTRLLADIYDRWSFADIIAAKKKQEIVAQSTAEVEFIARLGSC
jgi:hypothetical protein